MKIGRGEIWQSKNAPDRLVEIRDLYGPMVTVMNGTGREKVLRRAELLAGYVNVDGVFAVPLPNTPIGNGSGSGESSDGRGQGPAGSMGPEMKELLEELARARGSSSITTVRAPIGAKLAAELLAHNPSNRGIRRDHVEALARDMAAGRWRSSHAGIALGPSGCLGDGQHRLLAICKSGVCLRLEVSQYHDEVEFRDARTVWDTGWKRTKGSALELAGLVPSGQGRFIAPVIEAMAWVDDRLPRRPTNEDVVSIFKERRESIQAVSRLNPREFLSATRAAFVLAHLKCPDEIEECIRLVSSKANLEPGSAALAIVRALPQVQQKLAHHEQPKWVGAMLTLLHKHVKGRPGGDKVRQSQQAIQFFLGNHFRTARGPS